MPQKIFYTISLLWYLLCVIYSFQRCPLRDIFITATNTDVGKTYTSLRLIDSLNRAGLKPGIFKPIETGVQNRPHDATILLKSVQKANPSFQHLTTEEVCPVQFSLPAAPLVAARGAEIDFALIRKRYRELKKLCDVLLIEGAGGLLVPLTATYFMSDLIREFDAMTLLVTHDRLGCINDTLLNLYYLKAQKYDFAWCVNLRDPETFLRTTAPFYKAAFGRYYTLQEDLEAITSELISTSR